MSQSYNYSITTDFYSSTKVNTKALSAQIQELINSGTINKILDSIDYDDDVDVDAVTITFRETLPAEEKTALDDVVGLHDGVALPSTALEVAITTGQTDESGRLKIVQENRFGTDLTIATHNLCDKTTWYYASLRSEDEELLDSGDGYTFHCDHKFIIDMTHGKVMDEDSTVEDVEHGYQVVVNIDGYEAPMREPFMETGGDYEVNYKDGYIVFFEDQSGKEVIGSYSYADKSTWVLAPLPGKMIQIEQAEAQFSEDIIIKDTLNFDIYVYNPYDLPNKVKYKSTTYKTMHNFIDEALGSYPEIPPIGGGVRGTESGTRGFPFMYNNVKVLKASQGIELRLSLKNDIPFEGDRVTATFYCSILDEES